MARHSSVDFDPDLADLTKAIGGHGKIRELCNDTLKAYVIRNADTPHLTVADRERIAIVRERDERVRAEETIIRDCWNEYIKVRMRASLARYGLPKKTLTVLIEEAKDWIFERYGRLPPDGEIALRFREYYDGEIFYWQEQRGEVHRMVKLQDLELRAECHELAKAVKAGAVAIMEANRHE